MRRPRLERPSDSQEAEEIVEVWEEVELEKERMGTTELGRADAGS